MVPLISLERALNSDLEALSTVHQHTYIGSNLYLINEAITTIKNKKMKMKSVRKLAVVALWELILYHKPVLFLYGEMPVSLRARER